MVSKQDQNGAASSGAEVSIIVETLRAVIENTDRAGGYRLLGHALTEFAEGYEGRPDSEGASDATLELSREIVELKERNAMLGDQLATTRADLEHRSAQLEAEQTRAHEFEQVIQEQRGRLEATRQETDSLKARVTGQEAELHKAHGEHDQLVLKLQRAELAGGDQSKVEKLEESSLALGKEIEALRAEQEQQRVDKDAEIAGLSAKLAEAAPASDAGQDVVFAEVWSRLAREKPPLVEGAVPPTQKSAERLVDTLVLLVGFVDQFDAMIRPFLGQYTKHHPPVKVPWDVYAKRDDPRRTIALTLAPVGGRPVGVARSRLRDLYKWSNAAMIACDVAIESIASELHSFLMGPSGAGSDPNRTIKAFLRDSGEHLFQQHVRELRGLKLAEAFGR